VLFHDAQHFLVIVPESPAMKRARHPTVSIAGELLNDRLDAIQEFLLLVRLVL
jgi:hypothetical protein